jgi:protease-4
MTARIGIVVFLFVSVACAQGATPRSTTRPAGSKSPATQPATRAAGFPSLKETISKLQEQKNKEQNQLKVAYIDFDRPVSEKPAEFVFFADETLTLQSILSRLHQAHEQKDVLGVLINLGATDLNLAQAQEVRDALVALNQAGKKTFVYADSYDTAGYVAASGAGKICMMEGGEIMIPGVGMETMFAKGLLDKVGVQADYVQIGQYKGADEQYTRTEPSPQMRGEMNKILDGLYAQLVEGIASHRKLPRAAVEEIINNVMVNGAAAKKAGLVDELVDQDGLRELLKKELGQEVNLLHDFGAAEREEMDWSNPLALLMALGKKPQESDRPAIALIYAEGVIVDGDGGEGLLGGGVVGSEDLRSALRTAVREEKVKAIVIRIDSPGGSALASEVMWQAARRAGQSKPVIVSVGSMAASGGYYLASAGEYIFADPTAIVGSIGVVGGKFVFKDLFAKVGLGTENFTRGRNADLFASDKPFSEEQRKLVTNWMKQTYEQFTGRVMSTRGQKIKDIDAVAQGRIFVAQQARELGLVDELGGIEQALAYAAKKVNLKADEYDLRILPPSRTLMDLLRGEGVDAKSPVRAKLTVQAEALFGVLSPATGRLLRQQIQTLQLLQARPVMLVSPYLVTVK